MGVASEVIQVIGEFRCSFTGDRTIGQRGFMILGVATASPWR
jgi:hypothetical protein